MIEIEENRLKQIARNLVWSGKSAELASWERLPPESWLGAVQSDAQHYQALNCVLPQKADFSKAFSDACIVMMVKDEVDIIGWNIRWLYAQGFRRFVVSDNLSSDGTSAILKELRKELPEIELCLIDDPIIRYMQSEKMTGLTRLAGSIWPDVRWAFPIDADEFLFATNGLSVLSRLSSEVDAIVICKVNHYLSTAIFDLREPTLFPLGLMPLRTHLGRQPPKIAFRPRLEYTISQGNHEIWTDQNVSVRYHGGLTLGFYYREFQIRSFAQFRRRVANGGRAVLMAEQHLGRGVGGDHWKQWYHVLQTEGELGLEAIFKEHFVRAPSSDLISDPVTIASDLRSIE